MTSVWILLPFFYVGGVEKWAVALARELRQSYDVRVISFGPVDAEAERVFSEFPVHQMSAQNLVRTVFRGGAPDICIAALTPANIFASCLFFWGRTKVLSSTHLTLSRESAKNYFHYIRRCFVYYFIGRVSDVVIAVSEGVKRDLRDLAKVPSSKIAMIYNPCFDEVRKQAIQQIQTSERLAFVAAGRLHEQKGFDLLIEAWSRAMRDTDERLCSLEIYGDGPLRSELQQQVRSLGLTNVIFHGNVKGLVDILSDYDVFVLSSRYEGFGNVIAEALVAGTYCVTLDCPHGPAEILKNGEFGRVLPALSVDALALEISALVGLKQQQANLPKINSNKVFVHLQQFTTATFGSRVRELLRDL